jgi:hypothetical protein
MIRSSGLRWRRLAVALLLMLSPLLNVPSAHADPEPEPLRIPRVVRAPKLSDFATGTPREAEAVITVFKQFDPHDGEPISQPTAAYLSYDSKNLYIGWICKDDPSKIRARVAPRKQIETDDRISIVIDTFLDHKHGYWFDTNPYGIQFDGRTTDGIGDDPSWEALWYSEGRITPTGYVVLQSIPFRSLRFPRAPKQIWNISLARMIQRTNEYALWPFVSRTRLPQFVGQFAPIEIDADISPGRNIQLTPYALFSKDSYLDPSNGFQNQAEHHPGLDAKAVIHDALTLDLTMNPDFSEIGSDDPKVQANQRFEVVYPERRPFFLENASIFTMPEELFFSRRIVEPQFGAKLTGSIDRWSVGALVADDRAPGEILMPGEIGHGDRAIDAVFRVEREFAHQSHVGLFLSSTNFGDTWNRVGSIDLRYLAPHNWVFSGQATTTQSNTGSGGYLAGPGYIANLSRSTLHNSFRTFYLDRSPGMTATLGYLSRSDIRYLETFYKYLWRPEGNKTLLAYGPSIDAVVNYDHQKRLENWSVTPGFSMTFDRMTMLSMTHSESYELYNGIGFRARNTTWNVATSWYQWLEMSAIYTQGTRPNYHPPTGISPFLANGNNASATVTIRPNRHLRFDQIYYYTRLSNGAVPTSTSSSSTGNIFTNHLIRAKINYQFNRDYAFNAIFDYNSMLPNGGLVDSSYAKQADTTLLFTYFPNPGTAFYLGYADTFQNMNYDANTTPAYTLTSVPSTSTDRQLFVKVSYLFRF